MSNNDGCAVARSNEVKDLGIKMGAPMFKIKDLVQRHNIHVFSSNFALYQDISCRVQNALRDFIPNIEIYSIDECFFDLTDFLPPEAVTDYAHTIQKNILNWVGMPTSIGIAPTKTLAKIANHIAKEQPSFKYVCNLSDPQTRQRYIKHFPIENIWGIGQRSAHKLRLRGIGTAAELAQMPLKRARQLGSVVLERLVMELNGIACITLNTQPDHKQSITVSRSFGQPVYTKNDLEASLIHHCLRAAEKLRHQKLAVKHLLLYVRSHKHHTTLKKHHYHYEFPVATDDSLQFITHVKQATKNLFQPGIRYAKSGVVLTGLLLKKDVMNDLFIENKTSHHLMQALDQINKKFGAETITSASVPHNNRWRMRQDKKSPRYTTHLDELPTAQA